MEIAYFDNAATTYKKPEQMHNFMHDFYNANSVNVGRGNHSLLKESNFIVKETRQLLLDLFKANNMYETIFTPTATEAINVVLQGQAWNEDDVIYISPFEHNAVYRTVKYLERTKHIKLKILAFDDASKELNLEAIRYQFMQDKPQIVVVTHVSNAFGKVIDIYSLGKLVKEYNARYMVDAAQSAGLLNTDIMQCMADYMIFAGHKTLYGPFGCSGFICKKNVAPLPLIYGGTGIDSANEDMPSELPTRYEAGSINIMAISGLNAALKWIKDIGPDAIREKEKDNYNRLYNMLSRHDCLQIIRPEGECSSIVSCIFNDLSPDNVGDILSNRGVIVRTGLHCAPLAHKTMGTFPAGTVRFSISYFTNDKDFEALEEALDMIEEG